MSGVLTAVTEAQAAKRPKVSTAISQYRSFDHVSPTSALVENLFSKAKMVNHDRRKSMFLPKTLELLLMLKENRAFWTIKTVDRAVLELDSSGGSVGTETDSEDDEN